MKRERILQAPMVLAGLPFIAGLYPRVTGSIESWGPDDAQSLCHPWDILVDRSAQPAGES